MSLSLASCREGHVRPGLPTARRLGLRGLDLIVNELLGMALTFGDWNES